jgi:hypothetical protein
VKVFLKVPKPLKEELLLRLYEAPEPLQITRRPIAIEERIRIRMHQAE